ncbi:hypothetical protein EKO04_008427 [Ascochyta lentis]|uniref:Uncharacterized protein n=1 Tax=Ascochyta lentis TaxID=205686 RepID=A0A8H7MHK9_9PLEO|nr:hypothetical protein EKO04_008427 [Ascochyta lentis]
MASDAQHPPPPPPHPRSLADWGRYYRVDVSIAHIEALCRGEQPTLALAYCDVVEHWLQLSQSAPADAARLAAWWACYRAAMVTRLPLRLG